MSRRHGGNQIGGQFAPRLVEMLCSPAYRVLSLSGHRIIARVEIEFARHAGEGALRGNENGKLPIPYADFIAYGVHHNAIASAIREVVALGFVEITEQGRAGNAEYRSASMYRLTYRHTRHAEPTHDWRRIKGLEEAESIAAAARSQKSKKQNPTPGKRTVSPPVSGCETRQVPPPEIGCTGLPPKTGALSISRVGDGNGASAASLSSSPAGPDRSGRSYRVNGTNRHEKSVAGKKSRSRAENLRPRVPSPPRHRQHRKGSSA